MSDVPPQLVTCGCPHYIHAFGAVPRVTEGWNSGIYIEDGMWCMSCKRAHAVGTKVYEVHSRRPANRVRAAVEAASMSAGIHPNKQGITRSLGPIAAEHAKRVEAQKAFESDPERPMIWREEVKGEDVLIVNGVRVGPALWWGETKIVEKWLKASWKELRAALGVEEGRA